MSTYEDELLLEEFTNWQEEEAVTPPDLTPAAFLKERRDKAHELWIARALDVIGDNYPAEGYQDVALPNDHMFALDTLWAVRETLRGDARYSDLTEPTERIYT